MANEFKAKNGIITPVIQVSTAGTASTPVITKTDDLNTGIFFPAADTIAFAEGGTEVARFDSNGRFGLGGVQSTDNIQAGFYNKVLITGGVDAAANYSNGIVQSDVISGATYYETSASTQAASFTVTNLRHFRAVQASFGAGSAVTNQYGFAAHSSLIGATNNYGFFGGIASGTGRWNFYASGDADNYFGGPTTISTNSSSNALRITQAGTGNALVVEDDTNPDSTPFVVTSTGQVIIGTTSVPSGLGNTSLALVSEQTATPPNGNIRLNRYTTDTAANTVGFNKARGTLASPTIVSSGDQLGSVIFAGYNGTAFNNSARILASVDGTPGVDDMPGRISFETVADGAAGFIERVRINSSGLTSVGFVAATGVALSTIIPAKLYSTGATYTDGVTAASGTVTHGPIVSFNNPAIAATNTGVTYTNASTLYINGAPTAGTNVTITNRYSLYVNGGTSYFGGNIGLAVAAPDEKLVVAGGITTSGQAAANKTSGGTFDFHSTDNATRILSWGSSGVGGKISFWTGNGGSVAVERFKIHTDGSITSSDLADAVGYKGTPINSQSAAYTLVMADQGKTILHPSSDNNARTFTIPANSSVAFPVGTTITFVNMINTLTIQITNDTLVLAGTGGLGARTLEANGVATAVKIASTTWIISGVNLS